MSTINEIFPDYASALAACGDGYLDTNIADVIAHKAQCPLDLSICFPETALNSIVALGIASCNLRSRSLTVLDYGGGCGFHYFQAERVFGDMRWAIVESDTMASRAAEVGAGKFAAFSEIASGYAWLGEPDLVHASGTLQCVPDPIASLRELLALQSPFFMLARFPVWSGATKVGVQISYLSENGIGPMPPRMIDRIVRYPNTFIDFTVISEMIATAGYEIIIKIRSTSADYMVDGVEALGHSFFYRHRISRVK